MAKGKEATLDELRERYHLIDDVFEELEGWPWFNPPDGEDEAASPLLLDWNTLLNNSALAAPAPFEETHDEPRLPYRAPKKVGRNEPCPCGSGKKYKKCCGA